MLNQLKENWFNCDVTLKKQIKIEHADMEFDFTDLLSDQQTSILAVS